MTLLIKWSPIRALNVIPVATRTSLWMRWLSRDSNDDKKSEKKVKELPKPPENCCQSGCDNCVWIKYVEEVEEYYKDGGEEARKLLDQLITDPSLKVFINFQLKNRSKDN